MADISIIVPVYNVEQFIFRCIDSILAQSFFNFELILVNDGSVDNSGIVCDKYRNKDNRIIVIHQNNGGLSAARNTGIDYAINHSESKWITFIDSDDWIHPEYLSVLLNAAIKTESRISVCSFLRTETDVQQNIMYEGKPIVYDPEDLWVNKRVNATVAWGKLYKKDLFRTIRFPIGKLHEDEFTTYKLLFSCKRIAYIPAELYFYFTNPNGIMGNTWTLSRAVVLQAFSEQCSFFHKNRFPKAEQVSAQEYFVCCAGVLNNLNSFYPDEIQLLRKTRRELRRIWRKYKTCLDYSMVGSKKNFDRLAHPIYTKLRIKWKHALILLRRILHA